MSPRLDPRLAGFARDMRNEPTPPEGILWSRLRSSKLGGFKFRRQAVIGSYIADFLCPSVGLIVELDGRTHEAAYDERRDASMRGLGFETLRFGNQQISRDLDGVTAAILVAARRRSASLPHPRAGFAVSRPSPAGEG